MERETPNVMCYLVFVFIGHVLFVLKIKGRVDPIKEESIVGEGKLGLRTT